MKTNVIFDAENMVKKPYKILFIDDSPSDNKYLSLLIRIKKLPIDPHFEYDAPKALQYLKECSAVDFPKAILIDINMPIMNGFEFIESYLKNFGKEKKHTLLYITSSSVLAAKKEKEDQHPNISAFIEKPFNLHQIQDKILSKLKKKC